MQMYIHISNYILSHVSATFQICRACLLSSTCFILCCLSYFLGFAKLFCFTGDKVLLIRTFNEQVGCEFPD